ncbi:MAG: rRNA maturation RNase YbeY [Gallionella sp.]|nr:rRNA maturation RNase YbeY [Gallionella sp.]
MNSKKTPSLSLAVQYASAAQNLPTRAQLRRWVKAVLRRDAAMTLRIVDEAEGRELNRTYRGKDYATNVLTFVYDDEQTPPGLPLSGEEILVGDVVICAPVVEREAREQGKDLAAHYAHLAIHAALHLQGYDHENDSDATEMETLEVDVMLKLRYPNPYQETRITNG